MKWNFQLSCQQHTPPRRRVASDGMGDSAESPSPVQLSLSDPQKLERCSSFSSSSTWIGESVEGGRHTVDTFNDYCRPLKITSKSFAHKAASGIHATNPKGKGETLCRILSQLQLLILSQQSRYSLFLSLAQRLAMKSQKFKFNSSQLSISSICITRMVCSLGGFELFQFIFKYKNKTKLKT